MAKKLSIFEPFELFGEFSTETDKDELKNPKKGHITFIPNEGIKLRIFGSFETDPNKIINSFQHPQIIHGILVTGQCISLVKNAQTNSTGGLFPDERITTFRCLYAFLGFWNNVGEAVDFKALEFSFTGIERWFEDNPFVYRQAKGQNGEYSVTFKCPDSYSTNITTEDLEFQSYVSPRHKISGDEKNNRLEFKRHIIIQSKERQTLEDFLCHVTSITNLFSILIGKSVYVRSMSAIDYDDNDNELKCQIIFKPHIQEPPRSDSYFDLPTTFFQLREKLDDVFNTWFELNQKAKGAMHLFAKSFNRHGQFNEIDLLIIIKAIEGFHRYCYDGKRMDEKIHNDLVEQLSDALPEIDDKDFLNVIKDKIKYSNEISLRSRLKSIFESLPEQAKKFLFKERNKFLEKFVNTRNYMSHYDEISKKEIFEQLESFYVSERLTCILTILIYEQLGLDLNNSCQHWITRSKYSYLNGKPILT